MRRPGLLLGSLILCVPFPFYLAGATKGQSAQSAGPKEDLSVLAGNMLNDTNVARTDLKKGDKIEALHEIERAQTDLKKVQAEADGATMIPVYQEFVSISMLQPVVAEHNARSAQANAAKASEKQKPIVVHQVAGDYTDVAVSTKVAQVSLQAAEQAIEADNLKRADLALSDVQDGVSIESVEANMPLSRARENLILARSAAERGNYTEARAALTAASNALAQFGAEGMSHSSEAKSLEQQINTYNRGLAQNHSDIVAKINEWWNTTSDWTPYKPAGQMSASR